MQAEGFKSMAEAIMMVLQHEHKRRKAGVLADSRQRTGTEHS